MSIVRMMHDEAMKTAAHAQVLRECGIDGWRSLYAAAAGFETEAAYNVPPGADSEPTRSILFRSAAWLSINAGNLADAELLVARGRTEHTPPSILAEFDDVVSAIDRARQEEADQ